MMDGATWYTNKDLFEKQQELRTELQQTRDLIKQYNGLGGRMDKLETALVNLAKAQSECMARQKERISLSNGIREWAGWVVAFLVFSDRMGWLNWMK
jgi:hypothetical protein